MAVGQMVCHLTDGPATRPIRRIELCVVQAGDGAPEIRGRHRDLFDTRGALRRRQRRDGREFADRVPLVSH